MNTIETSLSLELVQTFETLVARQYGVTVGKRSGDGITVPYPILQNWAPESILRVWEYGTQRFVNDRIGGSDTDTGDKILAARAMMEKIISGDWARARGAGVDVETEIRRVFMANAVRKMVGKAAWDTEWKDAADLEERLDATFEKQDDDYQSAMMVDVANEIVRRKEKAESLARTKIGLKL